MGPSLIAVFMLEAIPALGRADLIAGNIILLHSPSVNVQAVTGYLSLALMFVCKAVQASHAEGFPSLTLLPHSNAVF